MIILPVAVLPTRTVRRYADLVSPLQGGCIIRYENVQGAFSLTTLTTADIPTPAEPPGLDWVNLRFNWRATFVIREFTERNFDSFGNAVKRFRFGYYQAAYANINADIHYINFEKQLSGSYTGVVNPSGYPSMIQVFDDSALVSGFIVDSDGLFRPATIGREFATLLKGELALSVIADIYICVTYNWEVQPSGTTFIYLNS